MPNKQDAKQQYTDESVLDNVDELTYPFAPRVVSNATIQTGEYITPQFPYSTELVIKTVDLDGGLSSIKAELTDDCLVICSTDDDPVQRDEYVYAFARERGKDVLFRPSRQQFAKYIASKYGNGLNDALTRGDLNDDLYGFCEVCIDLIHEYVNNDQGAPQSVNSSVYNLSMEDSIDLELTSQEPLVFESESKTPTNSEMETLGDELQKNIEEQNANPEVNLICDEELSDNEINANVEPQDTLSGDVEMETSRPNKHEVESSQHMDAGLSDDEQNSDNDVEPENNDAASDGDEEFESDKGEPESDEDFEPGKCDPESDEESDAGMEDKSAPVSSMAVDDEPSESEACESLDESECPDKSTLAKDLDKRFRACLESRATSLGGTKIRTKPSANKHGKGTAILKLAAKRKEKSVAESSAVSKTASSSKLPKKPVSKKVSATKRQNLASKKASMTKQPNSVTKKSSAEKKRVTGKSDAKKKQSKKKSVSAQTGTKKAATQKRKTPTSTAKNTTAKKKATRVNSSGKKKKTQEPKQATESKNRAKLETKKSDAKSKSQWITKKPRLPLQRTSSVSVQRLVQKEELNTKKPDTEKPHAIAKTSATKKEPAKRGRKRKSTDDANPAPKKRRSAQMKQLLYFTGLAKLMNFPVNEMVRESKDCYEALTMADSKVRVKASKVAELVKGVMIHYGKYLSELPEDVTVENAMDYVSEGVRSGKLPTVVRE